MFLCLFQRVFNLNEKLESLKFPRKSRLMTPKCVRELCKRFRHFPAYISFIPKPLWYIDIRQSLSYCQHDRYPLIYTTYVLLFC